MEWNRFSESETETKDSSPQQRWKLFMRILFLKRKRSLDDGIRLRAQVGLSCLATAFVMGLSTCLANTEPDLGDHAQFSHAMKVETRLVDGVATVFQYGEVRPEFEALAGNGWRNRLSLDGEWNFQFESEKESRTVQVPHNWEAMPESKFWDINDQTTSNPARFDGAGWYRKTFSFQKQENRRYRLEFRGVRERARVWLNDKPLAMHEGLGAPFSIDITEALLSGENSLKLKVLRLANFRKKKDGSWKELEGTHTFYPKAPDYWPYAGMTGSVALWDEPETTVRKVQVRTHGDQLVARVFLTNTGKKPWQGEVTVESEALSSSPLTQSVTLSAGQVRVVEFTAPTNKQTIQWTPNSPQRYQLKTRLLQSDTVVDGCTTGFGLREFKTADEKLELNGQPIFLKGVAAYAETDKGAALTRAENRTILQRAKDAGANFVRLPVRQCNPMTYQLADEMGLMVTGEWGGFWYKEKSMAAQTEDRYSVFQSMARVAVWDLMNHPSVILWCTNNECHQFCPEYEPFVKMNHELVREIDDGLLPITWAAWHPHLGEPHFQWADVVGFNEYRGAMDPFENLRPDMETVVQQNPGKPILILENGSWAALNRRGKPDQRGTEDWQADLLRRQWEVLQDFTPPLSGYTFWTLQDYRSRKTYTGNKRANGWSGMGMLTPKGEAKLVRDVYKNIDWTAGPQKSEAPLSNGEHKEN